MENWGLITYRETALLYDPESTSSADKQWVGVVIAHELAHQVNYYTVLCYIDLCAIPDFAIGAMENWGLITYRESALLVDPIGTSSASQKQRVATIVAHELAHQVERIGQYFKAGITLCCSN